MAHFAEVDDDGNVLRVIVISNDDILDGEGVEQESLGVAICRQVTGTTTRWVQTSYNGNFRNKFPDRPGFTYDEINDVFVEPSPYPSWILNENFDWEAPVPIPDVLRPYGWNESTGQWDELEVTVVIETPIPSEQVAGVEQLP
jgi:hypothetical protein